MAHSMTGYASQDVSLTGGTARWEIRSVNHRYLELSFKLPKSPTPGGYKNIFL